MESGIEGEAVRPIPDDKRAVGRDTVRLTEEGAPGHIAERDGASGLRPAERLQVEVRVRAVADNDGSIGGDAEGHTAVGSPETPEEDHTRLRGPAEWRTIFI